jgi:hypothetical protein
MSVLRYLITNGAKAFYARALAPLGYELVMGSAG